jgi:hypothetical protein
MLGLLETWLKRISEHKEKLVAGFSEKYNLNQVGLF